MCQIRPTNPQPKLTFIFWLTISLYHKPRVLLFVFSARAEPVSNSGNAVFFRAFISLY